jgi:hypothetical protein
MKTTSWGAIGVALLLVALSPAGRADDRGNTVSWETIIGTFFIGAMPGTSANTVGGVIGGGEPWSTLGGHAYVDLSNGIVDFQVKGLVLAGGNGIGTTGGIPKVEGTLVCSPASSPMVFNTPAVTLSAQGNAEFHGSFGPLPTVCTPTSVAFLIVIPTNNHWIANGAVVAP